MNNSIENLLYIQNHPNPLTRYAGRVYSQSDEDGITLEILKRIKLSKPLFLEASPGDGVECNTLVLPALGWQGQWIGAQNIASNFKNFTQEFITVDNILDLINLPYINLLSLDLDGNDYHILKKILTVYTPDVLILEYNAKFIPPIEFVMPYNPEHNWDGTDYFGASLQSFVNLLQQYTLVCCNPTTGANAFFVLNKYRDAFHLLSTRDIYVPPRYAYQIVGEHPTSLKTVNHLLC